nr:hypothetical protein [Tanacetum cinerariifolium]
EIDIVTDTDDVLPPGVENNDDTDGEIYAVDDLRVDNFISNCANKFSDDEEFDFDNPSVLLPPPEPPDAEFDFDDNELLPDEDVPTEEFKVYSNPFFNEDEINSDELDPHCFNVESDFVKSLLNRDTFIDSSSKFDFSGELAHVNLEIT